MGHREDLLEGAKRCLLEKGFARTTARDVVKESGTNLASIGYHYGSKDALLAQAYVALAEAAAEEWGGPGELPGAPGSLERIRAVVGGVTDSFGKPGSIWHLSMELITMGDKMPDLRAQMVAAQREAGRGFIGMVMGEEPPADDPSVDTLGKFFSVLVIGLFAQYTFDPEFSPSADELTEGLRQLMEAAR
ncbi:MULTISPECIES: TetR/AcrR family transcriptional regulator [unclassified Streptomyces]|uniref:TetR/AcrR family transcriptional regulator n=1 Tax=unclassified Streptomyces TaxID=2593676 RepID=UPI000DBA0F18|nr:MULTISPECIES: TetR/AcrR family transcriptional regulator [unclassified Streptomyces]MYT69595.1 TetR family transcriptional regulator [Streptomyces sp. SID8367]RAJ74144.1 TetR family transcriptional regulator [Streptomyces sp. PsTaAH-137]